VSPARGAEAPPSCRCTSLPERSDVYLAAATDEA
jgi:hypothetical protein